MKFRSSENAQPTTTKAYQFGCLQPLVLPEEAIRQLRLMNTFWNSLVGVEEWIRERKADIWRSYGDILALEAEATEISRQLADLRREANDAKAAARSSRAVSQEGKNRIKDVVAASKAAWAALKAAKSAAFDAGAKDEFSDLEDERRGLAKSIRQALTGGQCLYWGSSNAVFQSFETARKKAAQEGAAMRRHRFTGEGTWTVQIQTETGQKPLNMADLFSGANKHRNVLQIDPVDFSGWRYLSRSEQKHRRLTTMRLRVASTPDRKPVFVELPVILHRPWPEDAWITGAKLTRVMVGTRYRYTVSLTVVSPGSISPTANLGLVAVDLGWRKMDDGSLRVAYWRGSDGERGELRLPADMLEQFRRGEAIQSIRDRDFNAMRDKLASWLASDITPIPDWLKERTATLSQWRAIDRLEVLVYTWAKQRFAGDGEIMGELEGWRRHEIHHRQFADNLRDQLIARRRDIYRVFARRLADTYGEIVVEDMAIPRMIKNPEVEEDKTLHAEAKWDARIAAPGSLRQAIKLATVGSGGVVRELSAAMTTRIHAACGRDNRDVDFGPSAVVQCPGCNRNYDQDDNACRNLLLAAVQPGIQEAAAAEMREPE